MQTKETFVPTKHLSQRVQVYAGVTLGSRGEDSPTAFGRLCEWRETPNQPADNFKSFGAYQRSLNLDCQEGQPGILQWTPDANTPDTVYYQANFLIFFKHLYFAVYFLLTSIL